MRKQSRSGDHLLAGAYRSSGACCRGMQPGEGGKDRLRARWTLSRIDEELEELKPSRRAFCIRKREALSAINPRSGGA